MTVTGSLPPAIIFILGAIVLPLLPRRSRSAGYLVFPLLAFIILVNLNAGTNLTVPFLNYEMVLLRVDRLSLAFGYVFIIMAFLGGIYGFHLKDTGQQVAALLYAGSSLGVIFAGDLLTLFIFWEIMAVSSVCLIWSRRTPKSTRAGMRYIIVHLFGGSVLLAGILWHQAETGSMLFNLFEGGTASYLILFGFSLNAAVPPLHAWLSDAYPEGTVTGSIYLSAFTTKVAVYALARGFAGFEPLIWVGTIMAIYGVVFAVLENDIRRLLAYHIISQVGYMVAAVGIGTEMAINGATAHAFAHILYKGLLFMGAGAVLHATGRSKLTEMGGLARAMPLVLGLYMVGAFSISGFPLFSGFVSKSMVVYAAELNRMDVIVLLLNLAAVGTFLHTGLKLPYFTWFGPQRSLKPAPIPRGMYAGMALTAGLCFAIGVYPAMLYNILPFPVTYQPYTATHVIETMQLLIFTGFGFWLLVGKLGGESTVTLDTDWFYRRPSRLAYNLFVLSLSRLFDVVERITMRIVRSLAMVSANPAGSLIQTTRSVRCALAGEEQPESKPFNPNRYRFPFGVMVLMVLLFLVVFTVWSLINLRQ
ncbi:MAG: Na(+)/H(+) antiporter subunit D [Chloroflexi bacterium]|nr:Na(+)/H(+) antiporter subunit D [Chloroflexota bacterium]